MGGPLTFWKVVLAIVGGGGDRGGGAQRGAFGQELGGAEHVDVDGHDVAYDDASRAVSVDPISWGLVEMLRSLQRWWRARRG